MNISRMLNNLFSGNKKLEINQNIQNKKKDQTEEHLDIKQVSISNIESKGQDIDLAIKNLKEQIKKESNPHQLDSVRISAVLSGEKTSRLDQFRTDVLKSVISEQNENSVIQKDTLNQFKKIISNKTA